MSNTFKFTSVSIDGTAISHDQDKIIYSYGVLPGELATGQIINKKKKKYLIAQEILDPHIARIPPRDSSYLSTSPWQIANYQWQIETKKNFLSDLFSNSYIDEFIIADAHWEYRTKVEFSFCELQGKVELAFFDRVRKNKKVVAGYVSLVSKEVNIIAVQILEWINQNKIAEVGLKSLTIRESKSTGKCMALLLFRHREKIPSDFEKLKTIKNLSGIMVAYSNPKSPASNIDEIFFKYGKLELSENIGNINLSYPIDGFFQNNLHIFPKVLARMNELLYSHIIEEKTKLKHPEISNSHLLNKLSENIKLKILELYCGIGTIGLCLSNKNTEIIGVDNISSNILYCQKNIKKNNIKSYQPILSASEKIDEIYFENVDLVILDPARVGLHHKVIKNLLKHKPNWIFYLSCNPVTQAHDVLLLSEEYSIKFLGGYDFYPHTPHLECLILLKRKR